MVKSYLCAGSNLGNRLENIERAIQLIRKIEDVSLLRCSAIRETYPEGEGVEFQPLFLNCVIETSTNINPTILLIKLQEIENKLGRHRKERWGPRTLDLDILLYGNYIISSSSPDLKIPHPYMAERMFVLEPLAELVPDLIHPTLKKKIIDIKRILILRRNLECVLSGQ